jgi:hypothetical protein
MFGLLAPMAMLGSGDRNSQDQGGVPTQLQANMDPSIEELVLPWVVQALLWRAFQHANISIDIVRCWPTTMIPRTVRQERPGRMPYTLVPGQSNRFVAHEDYRWQSHYPDETMEKKWKLSHNIAMHSSWVHWGFRNFHLRQIAYIARVSKEWYRLTALQIPLLSWNTVPLQQPTSEVLYTIPYPLGRQWPLTVELFNHPRPWGFSIAGFTNHFVGREMEFVHQILHVQKWRPECDLRKFPLIIVLGHKPEREFLAWFQDNPNPWGWEGREVSVVSANPKVLWWQLSHEIDILQPAQELL